MYTSIVTKSSENVEENNMVSIDFLYIYLFYFVF